MLRAIFVKIYVLSIFLNVTSWAAQEKLVGLVNGPKPLRDLMIFVDTSETKLGQAVSAECNIALCQQAAPLIVSVHTLSLFSAQDLEQKLAQFLVYSDPMRPYMYLMIPKSYISRFLKNYYQNDQTIGDLTHLGFRIASFDRVSTQIVQQKVEEYKKDRSTGKRIAMSPKDIYTFFNPSDGILWNMYVHGHGQYPYVKGPENVQGNFTPAPLFTPKSPAVSFDLGKYDAIIAGFNVRQIRELLTYFNKIGTNFAYLRSCYSGGFNSLLFYNATLVEGPLLSGSSKPTKTVAGIATPAYTFVIGSTTDAVAYASNLPEQQCMLKRENINSEYTNFGGFFYLLNEYRQKNLVSHGPSNSIASTHYSDDELRAIIREVTNKHFNEADPLGLANLPQVMFPNTRQFVFFPLDPDKSTVLSQVQIEVAQRTNSPITIEPRMPTIQKQKNAVERSRLFKEKKYEEVKKIAAGEKVSPEFLFLPIANIPVEIQVLTPTIPLVISLLPGIGLHTIKSIDVTKSPGGNLSDFIRSFPIMFTKFPKYFYITTVIAFNDDPAHFYGDIDEEWPKNKDVSKVTMTDVVIAVREKELSMMCTVNNKTFYFSFWSHHPKKKIDIIYDDEIKIEKLSDDPVKNAVMNYKKGYFYKGREKASMQGLFKLLGL